MDPIGTEGFVVWVGTRTKNLESGARCGLLFSGRDATRHRGDAMTINHKECS